MRYAACVEYDGSLFHGWQRQSGTKTVQGNVENAIGRVADAPIGVVTAGRTDTGVHATGQIFHFNAQAKRELKAWQLGGNRFLPPGVTLHWVCAVSEKFHARYTAIGRSYRYIVRSARTRPAILRQHVTWDYRHLDIQRMIDASRCLLGTLDFSAYRAGGCQAKSPVRTLRKLEIRMCGQWLWIDFDADGFLHHMVRNIAGVLLAIGAGERPVSWAEQVLEGRDRSLGGVTAPPDGLYLCRVDYPNEFDLPASPERPVYWREDP